MATYKPATRTDFNLTGDFSGEDLDISWAHLQVKALVESSNSTTITIDGESFDTSVVPGLKAAVQKMYTANVDSQIASPSLGDTYDLPEILQSPSYTHLWKVNDVLTTSGENKAGTPTELYESVSGNFSGTVAGSYFWARSGKNDPYLLTLQNGGSISLDDQGAINNDGPYTFGFTFKTKQMGDGVLFSKGSMKITLKNTQLILSRDGTNKTLNYDYPDGTDLFTYHKQESTFHLQRFKILNETTGKSSAVVKLFLNGNECVQKNAVALGAILRDPEDLNSPILFKYTPNEEIKDVFLSTEIAVFPKGTESLFFASRLDQTNSFNRITGTNELLGDFGTYSPMVNMPGVSGQENAWADIVSTGNANGTPPFVSRNLSNGYNRNFKLNDFDISKNFTISFWVRGKSTQNFEMMDIVKDANLFRLASTNGGQLLISYPNGSSKSYGSGIDWLNNYNHVILSKNGNRLDLFINGTHIGNQSGVSNRLSGMTSSQIVCGSTKINSKTYYLSSVKIMQYAAIPPYLAGQTSQNADVVIGKLKNNII